MAKANRQQEGRGTGTPTAKVRRVLNTGVWLLVAVAALMVAPTAAAEDDAFTADTEILDCEVLVIWMVGAEPMPENLGECLEP